MKIDLNEIFDAIIFKEGITPLNDQPRKFRIVIPYLGSILSSRAVILLDGDDWTRRFNDKYFGVGNYKNMNVDFECWRDFYDYDGPKNDRDAISRYLYSYRRNLYEDKLSGHGQLTYWYKEESDAEQNQ